MVEAEPVPEQPDEGFELPTQTPLFHALHSDRYERQELIRLYEQHYNCRLVVMIDLIFPNGVTLFEELVNDADPDEDLHLLLASPGGDGESALRIARTAQAHCKELTVIVPDRAKSAATLLCMAAHRILMGPSSDLGPVDPQLQHPSTGQVVPAKDLVEAWNSALGTIAASPATLDFLAVMFAGFNAPMVQEAKSALDHTERLVEAVLDCPKIRTDEEIQTLKGEVLARLQEDPKAHTMVVGPEDADEIGLPVEFADLKGAQWQLLWRLYAKYFALDKRVYEGHYASLILDWQPPGA